MKKEEIRIEIPVVQFRHCSNNSEIVISVGDDFLKKFFNHVPNEYYFNKVKTYIVIETPEPDLEFDKYFEETQEKILKLKQEFNEKMKDKKVHLNTAMEVLHKIQQG